MTPPEDENQSRSELTDSGRENLTTATSVGPTDASHEISVSLIVRRRQPLSLHELQGQQVTPEEFLEKYAAAPADFDRIRAFAKEYGLAVDEQASSLERRTIVLRGTVPALEKAFGTTLHDYTMPNHPGKKFHGYTGTLSVPGEVKDIVEAVLGLDARPVAHAHFRHSTEDLKRRRQHRRKKHPTQPQLDPVPFNPPQVAALYNFPTGFDGTGQTIGIIELGGGYDPSDLEAYFQSLGIKPPSVTAVSVDGGANVTGDPNGADGEVQLDIEVAGSIAPGAKIVVYFTPNTDQGFIDAITTAVHDTENAPTVISISWGGPESSWSQQSLTSLDNACQSAGALGITITVASGDDGSSDGGSGSNVDFPASSPHVLGCGGTELIASGGSIEEEVVWNDQDDGGGATGGGVSTVFALPTWQANAGVPASKGGRKTTGGRGVPDVSGDAAPESGYNITVDGEAQVVGGTSAVAPLWAALIAIINQQRVQAGGTTLGFVNPALYAAGTGFNDILDGSNGSYSAGTGWDACTGLGTPNGTVLAAALASVASGS